MAITNPQLTEAKKTYEIYWNSYINGDLENFASTLDKDFEMIGTSESEVAHNKAEGIAFFKSQIEEVVKKADMRNRQISAKEFNEMVLINETCDIYVLTKLEWIFYSKIRISTLLHETETGWKVIQQHGSLPDMRVEEGETMAIEKINRENLELRDAIKRRTIELENKNQELAIEAALEKVRAVAMGMKKPEDMLNICRIISEQLQEFGVRHIRNIQTAIIDEEKGIYLCYQYFTPYDKEAVERTEYLKSPVEHDMVRQMLASKDGHFTGTLSGKELEEFREHRKAENHFPDPILDEAKELSHCFLSIGKGGLGLTLYHTLDAATLDLFKRFHQVFSLAYSRFQDIEKAEARAREVEIELALERVRAQTMAMHSSEDVGNCIVKMFAELTALGVDEGTRFGIGILNPDNEINQLWTARKDGQEVKMHIGNLDMNAHPLLKRAYTAWRDQIPFHKYILEGEDLLAYYQMLNKAPDYKIQIPIEKLPKQEIQHCFIFEHGFFYAFSAREFQPELIDTIQRFSSQFAQTYRRYLDLVMAEGQAREAEIQLALERVRSKSLAMHHTRELQSVIHSVHQELLKLKLSISGGSFIVINSEIENEIICWGSGGTADTSDEVHIPRFDKPFYTNLLSKLKSAPSFFTEEFTQEEKIEFFTFLFSKEPWSKIDHEQQQKTLSAPGGYTRSCVVSKLSSIFIINHFGEKFSDAENDILRRFGKVFEQAYTRFLDLQKAEAQAREAEIQLALERVRARSMAMHKSEELLDVITVVSEQLQQLNFRFVHVSFANNEIERDYKFWVSVMGMNPMRFNVPYADMPIFAGLKKAQHEGMEFYTDILTKDENSQWHEHLLKHGGSEVFSKEMNEYIMGRGMARSISINPNIILILANYASVPYSEEENQIIARFGRVFEQSYTRFLDLQNAEVQAREAKIEAALERVRSKTMAMHTSQDVGNTIFLLFDELKELAIQASRSGVFIMNNDGSSELWTAKANSDGIVELFPWKLDMTMNSLTRAVYQGWKDQENLINFSFEGKSRQEYYQTLNDSPEILSKFNIDQLSDREFTSASYFQEGGIYVFSPEMISKENANIIARFASVFGQTYTRFLDLQKAELQAREAEIELALERVRARTMAMQHSDELAEASAVLDQQVRSLGIETWGCAFHIYADDPEGDGEWFSSREGALPFYKTPRESFFLKFYEKGQAGERFHVEEFLGEDCKTHYDYLLTIPVMGDVLREILAAGGTFPKSQYDHIAFFKHGYILFITYEPVPEAHAIFQRFAKVFEQTYTRFLDLQKAEAQAREAQIEAALEKVRSRSLAMHNSDELNEVVKVLFEKMTELKVPSTAVGIQTFTEDSKDVQCFVCGDVGTGIVISQYQLPYFDHPIIHDYHEVREKNLDLYVGTYSKKVKDSFYDVVLKLPELKDLPAEVKTMIRGSVVYKITMVPAKKSVLAVNDFYGNPLSESQLTILQRFAKVFDQAYTRFLDLQKAEAQAREAKIETALEKVRSRTMGMQSSEELPEVANLLFLEVQALGIPAWSCGHNVLAADKKSATAWMSSEGTLQTPFTLRLWGEASFDEMGAFVLSNDVFMEQELGGKALIEHYNHMKSFPDLKPTFDQIEAMGLSLPTFQINHLCKFSHGFLLFITYEPVPDAHDIFLRFTKVFDQTYTRFLDLQKAEAQAREAKIEVALEKVRSRTMGMQKSDELADVANVLFQEMNDLVSNLWTCGFVLCEKDRTEDEWWLSLEDGFTRGFFLPNVNDYAHAHLYEGWLKKDDFRTVQLEGDKLQEHYDWLMEIPIAKNIFDEMEAAGMQRPEWQKLHAAYFSKGYLVIITRELCPEEAIFKRFAQVFDLTYTRFLDLQKAESQAREAQIEAALEKVRSRSLAMQSPSELVEVAQLLREEMGALGVEELETSSIYIQDEDSGLTQCWFTIKNSKNPSKTVSDQMNLDLKDTWVGRQMLDFYQSDQLRTSILMKGKQRVEWIHYCENKSKLLGKSEFYGETIPERTYHIYKFSNGFLGAASPSSISEESWDLLRRATGVFSFAFTRFQDLQLAQASAQAAKRQASLDRVRADISSMRSAADLELITPLIFRELTILGVPFIRCGVFIIQEKEEIVEAYLSSPDGNSLGVLRLPYQASDLTFQTVEAWRKGVVYRQHWNKENFIQWIEQLMEQDQIQDSNTYQGSAAPPESLDLHFVPFTQGMLYVGAVSGLDEDEIGLVQALAKAFSIAFARYEDFVKLENAKAEIESAMSELKATQSQLVQQEKLASLGQLTAGIAHEIKNPLNFVNNFSELSSELIDEVFEELEKLDDSDTKEEIIAILQDVKGNLTKVHEHGTRANGIVTSMLQHSRGGDGKMEPTDLNALLKEYVNLSFHGMRAGKNPINVDLDFQLEKQVGRINLVSEDFSRVIVNLCNNAFDAMRGKILKTEDGRQKTGDKNGKYEPMLTVSTKLENGKVLISFEDNGPGIPDEIKDKILQPFFTTKKGTEGTGLGLSITHDIVKAHGGELKVESVKGEGSEFRISLPIK